MPLYAADVSTPTFRAVWSAGAGGTGYGPAASSGLRTPSTMAGASVPCAKTHTPSDRANCSLAPTGRISGTGDGWRERTVCGEIALHLQMLDVYSTLQLLAGGCERSPRHMYLSANGLDAPQPAGYTLINAGEDPQKIPQKETMPAGDIFCSAFKSSHLARRVETGGPRRGVLCLQRYARGRLQKEEGRSCGEEIGFLGRLADNTGVPTVRLTTETNTRLNLANEPGFTCNTQTLGKSTGEASLK
ncbi:hypothetical protein Bbelb_233150 [Branchiostoma belcheri]|nr:hypothetical protein Bbelb_233150 [Branchiostoma belcheri]